MTHIRVGHPAGSFAIQIAPAICEHFEMEFNDAKPSKLIFQGLLKHRKNYKGVP